jgi:Ser/Thr protein kinase RdoA (MazF antagonist)
MGTHPVAPDWPPLTLEETDRVLARYPEATGAVRVAWLSPRPLSAAALVGTPSETVFVKRHHRAVRTAAGLAEEHAYLAHLARRGAPVARVLRTADGSSAVETGDWTYEVHTRAPGVDVYRDAVSWSPFVSVGHAVAAGAALARLHRATAGFRAPARRTHVLVASFRAFASPDPVAVLDDLIRTRPALADYFRDVDWRDDVTRLHLPFHRRLTPYLPRLRPSWTHNDWHASNLLWSHGGPDAEVTAVLDVGLADRTTAVHDLATAIERNTIPWLEITEGAAGGPRLDLVKALLDGYTSVLPLDPAAAAALPELLPLVHVEFALSEVEYFHGILGSRAGADLAYHEFLVGHTAWFTGARGRDLLDALRRRLTPPP